MKIELSWQTVQRRVNDVIPLSINPRKISEAKRMKMIESIQRFNLVDLPIIDIDNTLISGHQRLRALQAIGRGDEMIDVRMPNRKLTEKELKEYNLLANTHFGEFDFEGFEAEFANIDFDMLGIDIKFDLPDMPDLSDTPDLSDLGNPDKSGTPDNTKNTPPQYEAQEDESTIQSYSHKNKEIDIDELEEDMTFKLKMSKNEYFNLQERLNFICLNKGIDTNTKAIFEILNFYENYGEKS